MVWARDHGPGTDRLLLVYTFGQIPVSGPGRKHEEGYLYHEYVDVFDKLVSRS